MMGEEKDMMSMDNKYRTNKLEELVDEAIANASIRTFNTGATRDSDHDKIDPEGFLSPLAILRFCEYMHKHRLQPDGNLRASDNWQKGMPVEAYMKSMWRHLLDLHLAHDGAGAFARSSKEDALCGVLFNAQGYLHELEKARLAEADEALLDELIEATKR